MFKPELDLDSNRIESILSSLSQQDLHLVDYTEFVEHNVPLNIINDLMSEFLYECKDSYNLNFTTGATKLLFACNNINSRKKVYVIAGYFAYINKFINLGGLIDESMLIKIPMINERIFPLIWSSLIDVEFNHKKYKLSLIHN